MIDRQAKRAAESGYRHFFRRKIVSQKEFERLQRNGLCTREVTSLNEVMQAIPRHFSMPWNDLFAQIDDENEFHGIRIPEINKALRIVADVLSDVYVELTDQIEKQAKEEHRPGLVKRAETIAVAREMVVLQLACEEGLETEARFLSIERGELNAI